MVRLLSSGLALLAHNQMDTGRCLPSKTVVTCSPFIATGNIGQSNEAADAFLKQLSPFDTAVPAHACFHHDTNGTRAQICNRSDREFKPLVDQIHTALDVILAHCASYDGTGNILTPGGLYVMIERSGVAVVTDVLELTKRKECVKRGSAEITECDAPICDPKYRMNEKGDCIHLGNQNSEVYCEVRGYKYYGPENT
ncbi:hypothetical protein BGZ61DRAFT_538121 [Ilyonectria robusta]|uniref:uncharacterized protein n=1 Tax=Ilyonectria robusta TaxID=1079257 RepID=UPI001E8E3B5D|nr:uncharacterized protein BGZ61DRAFT_538121 [Ilyonectria robusta]KAH8667172.1 hypothetical protein BGZ61DRAFT_538121 [Ilyonectria robusta]